MTRNWKDFERYFSEHVEEDTAKLTEEVKTAVARNIANIHPAILASIPGIINITCTAVCGGVLNMLENYHKWREEQC